MYRFHHYHVFARTNSGAYLSWSGSVIINHGSISVLRFCQEVVSADLDNPGTYREVGLGAGLFEIVVPEADDHMAQIHLLGADYDVVETWTIDNDGRVSVCSGGFVYEEPILELPHDPCACAH